MPCCNMTADCCDDAVIIFGPDNNFTPSTFYMPDTFQPNSDILPGTPAFSKNHFTGLTPEQKKYSPPGVLLSTNVDLSDICIFRI